MKLPVLVLLAGCAAVPHPVEDVAVPATPVVQLDAIEADITAQTAAHGPLAGEARAAQDAIVLGLPEAAAARARIEAALHAAGQARCTALDASTPYESWIVARYCAHFGVTRHARPLPATDASARYGDDTNAFYERAGVEPTRANLPTHDAYAAQQQATLAANLRTELERGYREQLCERDTYSLEAAAACAYQDAAAAPPVVHAALRAAFGDEEPLLAPLLGH